ncbi:MAG: DUF3987 domain-containing protein [Burkholderiaceae bacterium]|nr:DUF3987 domain-containing protein [Burkholderiaceae bacterium]
MGDAWDGSARGAAYLDAVTAEQEDDGAHDLPAPALREAMFYGLAGEVMRLASEGTEVHPAAAGAAFLAYAGVALGRRCALLLGNEGHHARLFTCHVGRSGRGGKGMALSLVRRIRAEVENLPPDSGERLPVGGHFHDGGLSSREGLAYLIRDESDTQGKDGEAVDPGVNDKRLLVIEEELANVLGQSGRDGNTLSAALRTAWDGHDLAPATKSNRTRASCPHIGLHACITPSELASSMSSRDMSNGFANRFLFVWAERRGVIPYPARASHTAVARLAGQLRDAIRWASIERDIEPDVGARALFARFYSEYRRGVGLSDTVRGLTERYPPYAWRLALLFALLDRVTAVTAAHMGAALAWLDYCADSTRLIFSTVREEERAGERALLAERVLATLQAGGGEMDREPLRTAVGRPTVAEFDAALSDLLAAGDVSEVVTPRPNGGRPLRTYLALRA